MLQGVQWADERRGDRFTLVDGVLFVHDTVNQQRALCPLAGALGAHAAAPQRDVVRLLSAVCRSMPVVRRLRAEARRRNVTIHEFRLARALTSALHADVVVRRLVRERRLRAVVVSTQHAAVARAAIGAAWDCHLPSVYVPHAPLVDDARYDDLPTTHAGLRGQAEADHYQRIGATSRPTVIGNPSVPDITAVRHQPTMSPVVAVSPDPDDEIADLLGMVVEALGDRSAVLAPHPRSDLWLLRRLLPAGWTMSERPRTLDLLRQGTSVLIQRSSGVAWEAMALGIPTIDVRVRDGDPVYPFLRDDRVLQVTSVPELRAALDRVTGDVNGSIGQEMTAVAAAWCDRVGRSAVDAGVALIRAALSTPAPTTVLLDRWKGAEALTRLSLASRPSGIQT